MTSVLEERFPEIESLNEHQSLARSHRSVAKMCSPFCQPDIESKFIIIRLIPVGNTVPDRLFIPSPCHNFGCVYSEVSGGLQYSQTAKPCHFNEDVDENHLLKKAYAFLFGSPKAFLQNEKWRCLLRNMFSKQLPSRSLRMKTFSQTCTLTLAK